MNCEARQRRDVKCRNPHRQSHVAWDRHLQLYWKKERLWVAFFWWKKPLLALIVLTFPMCQWASVVWEQNDNLVHLCILGETTKTSDRGDSVGGHLPLPCDKKCHWLLNSDSCGCPMSAKAAHWSRNTQAYHDHRRSYNGVSGEFLQWLWQCKNEQLATCREEML